VLDGGTGGVEVTGTINASGRAAGQRGGRVQITGSSVRIAPTVTIDVSGDAGGGTILIGGGPQGTGPLAHAQSVTVEGGAQLTADALTNGRGGTVVVWSDGDTTFNGAVSARGGATGGDGGSVETSGHLLAVGAGATVDAGAANGAAGSWLLDPSIIFVVSGGSGAQDGKLPTVNAGDNSPSGTFTISAGAIVSSLNTTDVILAATTQINVNAAVDASGNTNAHNLALDAPTVFLGAPITLKTGATLSGTATTVNVASGARIQNGLDAAASGATVNVAAGTYAENLVISHPVTLLGAQNGVDARTRTDTGASIIIPGTADPSLTLGSLGSSAVITINANNVTVDGFIINGSNPALSGVSLNGVTVNVDSGIFANGNAITVTNNVLRNFIGSGVFGFADGLPGSVSSDNVISQNRFTNITTPSTWGIGVILNDNFYAQVTNNLFESVRIGVQIDTFAAANPGAAASVSDNEIHATRTGIFNNLSFGSASPFDISNNTISALASSETREWVGIAVVSQSIAATATISGNTIDGTALAGTTRVTAGYEFVNSSGVVVDGGTVSNVKYGVWLTDQAYYGGPVSNVTVQNVAFHDIAFGAITVEDVADPANPSYTAAVIIGAGNTYGANVTNQLLLAGAKPDVSFSGGGAVDEVGVLGAGLYIETVNSSSLSGGGTFQHANASINQGIAVVNDGGTVNVYPGTFTEAVVVDHPLTLRGARAGQDPTLLTNATSGPNAGLDPTTNTIIDERFQDLPGIWIQASNVTVDGFTIVNSLQAGIRVGFGSSGGKGAIDGTRISNNYIYGNGNGILFQNARVFHGSGSGSGSGCESWCGEYSYAPGRFTNTIIDRNRIEQNNLVRGHIIGFSGEPPAPIVEIDATAGNHGIVFAGNTENTLVSRNLILNNNGYGIFIAGSSNDTYDGSYNPLTHLNMAIVGNQIVNPGDAGIQIGRDYFYGSIGSYIGGDIGGVNGTIQGLAIVLNTISGAFNCAGDGNTNCGAMVFVGEGTVQPARFTQNDVDLRGAINFDNVTLQGFGAEGCDCESSVSALDSFSTFVLGEAAGLLGAGITVADLAAIDGTYLAPSVYIGFNAISGAGYGVSIHSTVDLGNSVVYINNNNLAQNTQGGLFYALTFSASGSGSGSGSGSSFGDCDHDIGCDSFATGRVIAAGNYWGSRDDQGDQSGLGNMDPVFGNVGPTFTLDIFQNTGFRADIQGTGALPSQRFYDENTSSYSRTVVGVGDLFSTAVGGVIVSSWRVDGDNQVGRLNELLANANTTFGAPVTYPFPITLAVGDSLAGYVPTNFVRVDDITYQLGHFDGDVSFDVYRGPGASDPSGRITRGVSTIREPLPLLANVVGVPLSAGASDNGTVDILPGDYVFEGGMGTVFNTNANFGQGGIVVIDKDNLTLQATLFGTQTPATPTPEAPQFIPTGTAPDWSYNPDAFNGTLGGRAFPFQRRVGAGNNPFTPSSPDGNPQNANEVVLWGGVAIVPNLVRGTLAGVIASIGAEKGSGAGEQAFVTAAATNNVTITGLSIVNGFILGDLEQLYSGFGDSLGLFGSDARIGVLIASGQNHLLANNTIVNCTFCSPFGDDGGGDKSVSPSFLGGGSIGVWILPGDAVFASLQLSPTGEGAPVPQVPATGANTQILQNAIVGWNTAGIMIDLPRTLGEASVDVDVEFVAPSGIMIQRNTIAQTCTFGCGVDASPEVIGFIGGAGIAIDQGVGVTITNNWLRDNEIAIFNQSQTVAIIQNQFRSDQQQPELLDVTSLPAIITTQPLIGSGNWFDANQAHVNFVNLNPAPDEFDHNPFLPGWQLAVPTLPIATNPTPETPVVVTVTFPSFAKIPSDGPFAFLADPFLLQQILGGGGGPSLNDIATAAGPDSQPQDCGSTPAEQIANDFLGGALLGNPGAYQQILQCQ
jgi:hypothetical protein